MGFIGDVFFIDYPVNMLLLVFAVILFFDLSGV